MSKRLFEDLPQRKTAPASGASSDAALNPKKIKQAVYDIRSKSRKEEIELQQAYNKYMSNSSMSGIEKDAVKKKLFGEGFGDVSRQIFDDTLAMAESSKGEGRNKKYKIRVTDRENNRTYVRYADRSKIAQLRSNPTISSVEMTEYGKVKETPKKSQKESVKKLDPVGQEDGDIDNDGDKDSSDKYLMKRRKAIGKAIKDKKLTNSESKQFHDWRTDFFESMKDTVDNDTVKKVSGKKVNNKITINPKQGYAEAKNGGDNDPCWDTHKQVGMKKKGGKMVPNCVPKEETEVTEKKKDDSYLETDFKKRQKNNEKARKEMEKVPGQKNPHFEEVEIDEENKPTNPSLWSRAKSLAKKKFDVYPSAYANGWAAKWYKSKGGGWKSSK